jgi:hypothetical protein
MNDVERMFTQRTEVQAALSGLYGAVKAAAKTDPKGKKISPPLSTAACVVAALVESGTAQRVLGDSWDLSIEVAIEILSGGPPARLKKPIPKKVDSIYKAADWGWEIIRTRSWVKTMPQYPEPELEYWEDPESPDYEPYRDDEMGEEKGVEQEAEAIAEYIRAVIVKGSRVDWAASSVALNAVRTRNAESRGRAWSLPQEYQEVIEYALLCASHQKP